MSIDKHRKERADRFLKIGANAGMVLGAVAVVAVGIGVLVGAPGPIDMTLGEGMKLVGFGYLNAAIAGGVGYFVGGAAGAVVGAAANAVEGLVNRDKDKDEPAVNVVSDVGSVVTRMQSIREHLSAPKAQDKPSLKMY